MADVVAVQHHVEGQRQSMPGHHRGGGELAVVCPHTGDRVGGGGGFVLDRQLHMVQARRGQPGEPGLGQRDTAGHQARVHAQPVGVRDQVGQVPACQGLPTRQMDLKHPERPGLVQDPAPLAGR